MLVLFVVCRLSPPSNCVRFFEGAISVKKLLLRGEDHDGRQYWLQLAFLGCYHRSVDLIRSIRCRCVDRAGGLISNGSEMEIWPSASQYHVETRKQNG
jgi:hypothetical protein